MMKINMILQEKLQTYEVDYSGVILVKRGDEVLYEKAFGYAHQGWQIPNKMDTPN